MPFNVFSINAQTQKQRKTKTCVPCNTVVKLGDGLGNWRTHVSSSSHQANVAEYDARIVRASASYAEDMDIDSTNSGEEQQQQQQQQQQQCASDDDVEDDADSDNESVDIAALRQSYGVFLSRRQESNANAELAADVESDGGSDDEIDEGDDDGDNPLDFSVDYETNEDWYPFENQLQFRLAAFFHADDRLKDRMMKKQLKSLLEDVAVMFREDKDLKVPSVRWMMDPSYAKRSKVPKVKVTTVKAEISKPNTDETVEIAAHMHKPSDCLKLLNADPTVSSSLSALPDKTPDQRIEMTQGSKWNTCNLFQHPCVTNSVGAMLWVGDYAKIIGIGQQTCKIAKFYTRHGVTFADICPVKLAKKQGNTEVVVLSYESDPEHLYYVTVPIDRLALDYDANCKWHYLEHVAAKVTSSGAAGDFCDFGSGEFIPIDFTKHSDFRIGLRYDRRLPVKIVPVNLFTDDTSGNRSKKWNKFDSWSLTPAALPLAERNKRENTHLIAVHNKLTALEMLPFIVEDLCELEKGVVMFDAASNQDVLVVAPLCFISADNPRHAELVCSKGLASTFPCRKCYYYKGCDEHWAAPPRNITDVAMLSMGLDLEDPVRLPNDTMTTNPTAVGYKLTGGEALGKLEAFDITKDCPVEILHTTMLGITKYLLLEFCNYLDSDELKDLELKCRSYDSKAFRRMLSSSLRLRRSFVGRDYKVISQQAAIILNDLLHHGWSAKSEEKMEGLRAFFDCFRVHGEVMSLLFMSKIETKFSLYKLLLNKKTEELTAMIGVVDNFLVAQGNMTANSKMGSKPKLHILHHIVEDIERFATAIHFESEKGEQFNKFLREHIFHTNRHNPSRDLLVSFGRYTMFRCIVNGGYFRHVASGRLVHASNKIIDFVRANDSFRKLYFGADRENVDNNEHMVTLKRGVSGLFRIRKSSGCQDVLAEITSLNKRTGAVYLKLFKPVITPYPTVDFPRLSSAYTTYFSTSIYTNTSKDDAANVRLSRSGTGTLEVHLPELSLLEALDIQVQATGQQERIINIGKFGSLWRLLMLAPEEVSSL